MTTITKAPSIQLNNQTAAKLNKVLDTLFYLDVPGIWTDIKDSTHKIGNATPGGDSCKIATAKLLTSVLAWCKHNNFDVTELVESHIQTMLNTK